MYAVDSNDEVVALHGVPAPEPGAPEPVVLASDAGLLLAYRVPGLEIGQPGPSGRLVMPEDLPEGYDPIAVVEFVGARAHFFGPSNDEALTGHPLASRGLSYYSVYQVRSSSWIREMEVRNRVHPRHSSDGFQWLRHFIITFHDSTFECVAHALKAATYEVGAPSWVRDVRQLLNRSAG